MWENPDWEEDTDEGLVFEGEFTPPIEPNGETTLPIAGKGTVELLDDGMVLEGREMVAGRGVIFVVVTVVVFVGLLAVAIALDLGDLELYAVGFVVLGGFYWAISHLLGDAAKRGTSQEYYLPYSIVENVEMGAERTSRAFGRPPDSVVVTVDEFEWEELDGRHDFYFVPDGDPAMLTSQLGWRTDG